MTDIIRITDADEDTTRRLAAIGQQTFAETFGHLYSAKDLRAFLKGDHGIEAWRDLIGDDRNAIWTAADNEANDLLGYGVAGPCGLPVGDMPPTAGELKRLYVRAAAQGTGLGTAMLEQMLDWLKANHDPVYLSVYAENHGAQRLYRRYGFEIVKSYNFMVGDHADPEFIMQLR